MTAKETLLMEGVKDPNFGLLTGTMPVILSAMELYAKQESIEFKNWIDKDDYLSYDGNEELYELYQQSKIKTIKK